MQPGEISHKVKLISGNLRKRMPGRPNFIGYLHEIPKKKKKKKGIG